MIIVAGRLHVDPAERDAYLRGCVGLMVQARQAPGCLDFHLTADPLEQGRINVYEQWESVADVEAFRGSGPSPEQAVAIQDAQVFQHEIAATEQV